MYKRLLTIICMTLLFVLSADGAKKAFTIVIDAGHGGKDFGAPGKVTNEKTLNLRYALSFGRIIEQNCPDVKVIYTRKTDRFLELWQRAEIANKAKANLFVSVHINSLPKGHIARGYQTYTLGRSRRDGNKAISCLNWCRTRIWKTASNWPSSCRRTSVRLRDVRTRAYTRTTSPCCA